MLARRRKRSRRADGRGGADAHWEAACRAPSMSSGSLRTSCARAGVAVGGVLSSACITSRRSLRLVGHPRPADADARLAPVAAALELPRLAGTSSTSEDRRQRSMPGRAVGEPSPVASAVWQRAQARCAHRDDADRRGRHPGDERCPITTHLVLSLSRCFASASPPCPARVVWLDRPDVRLQLRGPSGPGLRRGGPPPGILLDRLDRELSFTDEQRARVGSVLETSRERLDQFQQDTHNRLENEQRDLREQIRRQLTPEQQARFDRWIEANPPRGPGRRGRGERPPGLLP
jgi:hypothetical protein